MSFSAICQAKRISDAPMSMCRVSAPPDSDVICVAFTVHPGDRRAKPWTVDGKLLPDLRQIGCLFFLYTVGLRQEKLSSSAPFFLPVVIVLGIAQRQ